MAVLPLMSHDLRLPLRPKYQVCTYVLCLDLNPGKPGDTRSTFRRMKQESK